MITRVVMVKVAVFLVVTVLGVGYVLTHYLGVGQTLLGNGYTAYVDLPDSGGIFTSASVTYRGVEVGKVGPITLHGKGIRVALDMSGDRKIPADTHAVVGNGSAIGEQYLDLQPTSTAGPYLHAGSVIPQSRTRLPVSTQHLLVSVDRLVRSLPRRDLRTMVTQFGATFNGAGPALRRLLVSSQELLHTAHANLPQTLALIDQSAPVLRTQVSLRGDVAAFSQHLASFSDQLRASNHDIRRVLDRGTPAARQLSALVHSVDTSLPLVLSGLADFSRPVAQRTAALRQVLLGYPYVIASTFGIFPGHGTRFSVPIYGDSQVPPCTKGFMPTSKHRLPDAMNYPGMRWDSFCQEPTKSEIGVRGAREAPEPDGKRLGDESSYENSNGLPHSSSFPSSTSPSSSSSSSSRSAAAPDYGSWLWLILGPLT